jgi:hypothetical protein
MSLRSLFGFAAQWAMDGRLAYCSRYDPPGQSQQLFQNSSSFIGVEPNTASGKDHRAGKLFGSLQIIYQFASNRVRAEGVSAVQLFHNSHIKMLIKHFLIPHLLRDPLIGGFG